MANSNFVRILPAKRDVPPIVGMDIDVMRSFELLARPQKPQVVGKFDPLALRDMLPQHALLDIPIKAPGSPVYAPEWAAETGIPQQVADHRVSTSKWAQDEWWMMMVERRLVFSGQPARAGLTSLHTDDFAYQLFNQMGRLPVCYLAVSSIPTRFHDCIDPLPTRAEFEQFGKTESRLENIFEAEEADELRDNFYKPRVQPGGGYTFPPGTLVCFNAANVHGVTRAEEKGIRSLMHIRTAEEIKVSEDIYSRNPALYAWLKRNNRLAL